MDATDNPFAAPRVDDAPTFAEPDAFPWFLVGTRKLLLMTVMTFGLYSIHWFERQYRFQKRALQEGTWPLARGLFSIFFAHELFRRVTAAAEERSVAQTWTASSLGGIFVACLIVERILDRASAKVMDPTVLMLTTVAGLALIGGAAFAMAKAQATINDIAASARVDADPNTRLTVWNYLVLALFGVLLFFVLAGPLLPV